MRTTTQPTNGEEGGGGIPHQSLIERFMSEATEALESFYPLPITTTATNTTNNTNTDVDDILQLYDEDDMMLLKNHYSVSIDAIKEEILNIQLNVLQSIVNDSVFNVSNVSMEDFQSALMNKTVQVEGETAFDEAARLALARVALLAQCAVRRFGNHQNENTNNLKTEGSIPKDVILDFFGLCAAGVKLARVQYELSDGYNSCKSSLIPPLTDTSFIEQDLLEVQLKLLSMQHTFFHSLGYDHHLFTQEMNNLPKNYAGDFEMRTTFSNFISQMTAAITRAQIGVGVTTSNNDLSAALEDARTGTKVISVQQRELLDDLSTSNVETMDHRGHCHTSGSSNIVNNSQADTSASITNVTKSAAESSDKEQSYFAKMRELQVARKAADLQQEILAELLMMDGDKRKVVLEDAKQCHDEFLQKATSLPIGPERINFVQSVSSEKQRKLVMHKLWSEMLAKNGGKEPTVHYNDNLRKNKMTENAFSTNEKIH